MALPNPQSSSAEDLLSARSKRSYQHLATISIYSTITALSAKPELDLSESVRLAMAQESADPVWSPSMSSNYDDDHDRDDEHSNARDTEDNGSVSQEKHVNPIHNYSHGQSHSPNPDFATPTMSESEYSRSPSIGSVRMAAVVQNFVTTSGLGISTFASNLQGPSVPPTSSLSSTDHSEFTPTASPSKRVLNARNLIINTEGIAAARPYPDQSTTPPIAMPKSAKIEQSPPPGTSRHISEYSHIDNFSSPLRTATLPPVPHTAGPMRSLSQERDSYTKLVRRSSTDSSLSYLSSQVGDEDETLGPNKASLLRMQSFLGPKMKHISPAPWSMDADASSVVSSSSMPLSESASAMWSEVDFEIGSVHMATKSVARSDRVNGKDGAATAATGTLKGLGLAITSASTVVANAATGGTSRPSTSSERSAKSGIMTASPAFSTCSGTRSGTTNDGSKSGLSGSHIQEPFHPPSTPLPPLPSTSATATVKVISITRSKTPENFPPLPSSAVTANLPPLSRSVSPDDKLDIGNKSELSFNQLKTVTSAPAGNVAFTAVTTCKQTLSSSMPESSIPASPKYRAKTPPLPSKRASLVLREPATGKQAAERWTEHQQQQTQQQQANIQNTRQAQAQALAHLPIPSQPASPSAPIPPAKVLKSRKSGFLKLFKYKEDHTPAPAVPRPSTDKVSSPKMSHAFAHITKHVSVPTDPGKLDSLRHTGATSPTVPTFEPRTPLRSAFASAVPFPHQRAPSIPIGRPRAEDTCKAETGGPPRVSLIKPSPDLSETQGPFADLRDGLSVRTHRASVYAMQDVQGDALAPSLSLRPVSMMLSSMPFDFLAEMDKSAKNSAHLQAVQTPSGSSTASVDSLAGRTSPARTPDTPSFISFDSDSNATPPSGQTPNTPTTEQYIESPTHQFSKTQVTRPGAFGLPTPPHSTSSSRTFSASSLPAMPISPSSVSDEAPELALTAVYKAKIDELEQLIISLRAELNAVKGESTQITLSDPDCKDSISVKKACNSCGCSCKTGSKSVLSRPRLVGHGNMFSSGRT